MLSAETIKKNIDSFYNIIDTVFPDRSTSIKEMYKDLGDERVTMAPASSFNYFHNAFPGGYIDHVLRVTEYSNTVYKMWQSTGLKCDNFTIQELLFAAMHHDLGKLGLPGIGNEYYLYNDSDWHRKNQGKEFKKNENLPAGTIQDSSIFLLQYYGIKISHNEFLGIKTHDGMYDESNKPYLAGFSLEQKLRNNLPIILHQADMMAARFEFERWAIATKSFSFDGSSVNSNPTKNLRTVKKETIGAAASSFKNMFN